MNDEDMKEMEERFRAVEGRHLAEDDNAMTSFTMRFGFPHDCHCERDYTEGNLEFVSECWADMCGEMMHKLEETRGAIYGILASGSKDTDEILRILGEVFYGDRTEGGTH